ncbi:hypothetical protein Tco_1210106 [Tanacetum coccineum]
MSESSKLSNESYVLYDRVMNPLTAHQERTTSKDRGTRRGRHSTSSSFAFDQPSSSHLNDDDDGNGKGTSRAITPSPFVVSTAQRLQRKYAKCLLLLVHNCSAEVNAASENMFEVTTASEYQVNAAMMPITTAKEKAQRRLEVKARITLMMGIPNEHHLKFKSIKNAKKLLEVVEKSFGGNAATRKTQRNLLKHQYENFTATSSEMLDQTFDRLQKLVSQLELLDEKLSQEDVNKKLLRSLSPEWNTHAVMWRNKADLDTMSMDDLYNNLKVYEPKVKGMSSSSSSTQNMDFVSSSNNNTSSTNGVVNTAQAINTAHGVSTASTQVNVANSTNIDNLSNAVICAFFASQPNSPQLVHEDLQQIHLDNMEEMDLRWQMRLMLDYEGRRAPRNQNNKNKESLRRSVLVETSTFTALVSCDGLGGYD